MAMRINASQETKARKAGRSSFFAGLSMHYQAPHLFDMQTPLEVTQEINIFPHENFWEHYFKRTDITVENCKALNILWLDGWIKAYAEYMIERMIPETEEMYKWKKRNMRGSRLR